MRVVWGNSQTSAAMAQWVADQIPHMNGVGFPPCIALLVGDWQAQPLGGVVFHNYMPQYKSIDMSIAASDPRWLTQNVISEILRYPFSQLGVRRITAITPSNRETSIWRFLQRFGWRLEGHHRKGLGTIDAATWSLLSADWALHRFNVDRAVVRAPIQAAKPSRRSRARSAKRRQRGTDASTTYRNGFGL